MTKEESLQILGDAKIDITLTDKGEIRASVLELAAKGVRSEADAEAHAKVVESLNETIADLEKRKTPEARKDLVIHQASKKEYTLAQPKSNFRGMVITAEILNERQDVLDDLLKSKSPILVENKEG